MLFCFGIICLSDEENEQWPPSEFGSLGLAKYQNRVSKPRKDECSRSGVLGKRKSGEKLCCGIPQVEYTLVGLDFIQKSDRGVLEKSVRPESQWQDATLR